jgi:imidazolonepropionase-like amidohydrolase
MTRGFLAAALVTTAFLGVETLGARADIAPPGFTPIPDGHHALVGARIFIRPGTELTNGTIVIRDGIIVAVTSGLPSPEGARVWDLAGTVVYAGFLDPYLTLGSKPSPVTIPPGEPLEGGLTSGGPRYFGVIGQERDPGRPGPAHGIADIAPERRVVDTLSPDPKDLVELRELGFTAANVVPAGGLLRGRSAAIQLGESSPNAALVRPETAHHASFAVSTGDDAFPNSLMGGIAAIRQAFSDAGWYAKDQADFAARPDRRSRPDFNASLAALVPLLDGKSGVPLVFEPGSILMQSRAVQLAAEFGLQPQLVASGQEWRRIDLVQQLAVKKIPFIVPLRFPALPKFPDEAAWDGVSLDLLRAWDWAPENPAMLRRSGAEIALTTHGLSDRKGFRTALRSAMDRGLDEADALAALTTVPARLCGLQDRLGTIEAGKTANLTICDAGGYFDPESRVRAVWIDGRVYESDAVLSPAKEAKPEEAKKKATARTLAAKRVARAPHEERGPSTNPPALLIRNATLWTSGPQGTLTQANLVVRDQRIESVGGTPKPGEYHVIDGTGLHVAPGIIDCHSHSMVLGAVNEPTLPSSAMVRIEDVINSETDNLHQQLAGGTTVANLLHGSANPIGGQNAVIKLRDGALPDGLRFEGAPAGIKFALGENVKQANWGEKHVTRFPQTRMGVGTFYVNRFTAAQQYREDLRRGTLADGSPVRRDLELEALVEILEGKRLIHCHSYRQDEILAFLRIMESFGVRVATFQHVLEGYKVADELARHGAGASSFSDWWAYKVEVFDAIPYSGSLMHDRGVVVSFNSDSSDHARRLNFEAAKAVKYGGTPDAEALKFVTLNPAKQLGIDRRVGSLEPGKDADFSLWTGSPLDSSSLCLETWIEGARYFRRSDEPARVKALSDERTALIAKARQTADGPGEAAATEGARKQFFSRALERARHLGVSECQDCRIRQMD